MLLNVSEESIEYVADFLLTILSNLITEVSHIVQSQNPLSDHIDRKLASRKLQTDDHSLCLYNFLCRCRGCLELFETLFCGIEPSIFQVSFVSHYGLLFRTMSCLFDAFSVSN